MKMVNADNYVENPQNKHPKTLRHRRGFQLITWQFYLSRVITIHVTLITTILCHVSLTFSDGRLYCNSNIY